VKVNFYLKTNKQTKKTQKALQLQEVQKNNPKKTLRLSWLRGQTKLTKTGTKENLVYERRYTNSKSSSECIKWFKV